MSAEPYFKPMFGVPVDSRELQRHDAAEASRIAVAEEQAFMRALGKPRSAQTQLPIVRLPELSEGFERRLADLDASILERGVAVDRGKLEQLGKERFEQLLAADRKARSWQRQITDLTSWQSVQNGLVAFEAPEVPRRTTAEQAAGSGKERDAVRQIRSFDDLWKFTSEKREILDDVYSFHDQFETLSLAHQLLEKCSADGRVRSRSFCGRKYVDYLTDWLSVLDASLTSVRLTQPLSSVITWLANERTPLQSPADLASDFFNVRAPSAKQIRLAQAIFDGFLLDHRDWLLWEHVGRATRTALDENRLAAWRAALAKRYPAVSVWHAQLRAAFYRDVGYGAHAQRQFEAARHRVFLDRTLQRLFDCAGGLLAIGLDEVQKGAVAMRFADRVICSGDHKQRLAQITRQLQAAFPASSFELQFEELQA